MEIRFRVSDLELTEQASFMEFLAATSTPIDDFPANQSVDSCGDFWRRAERVSKTAERIRYIHVTFLGPPISVLGILGNLALLFVLKGTKFKSSTYRYLLWLALSDLIHLTSDILYMISTVKMFHRHFGYLVSWTLCHTLHTTIHTFGTWSSFMVILLTGNRLRFVWDPYSFRNQTAKTHLVALGSLFISVVIHVVGSWRYEVLRVNSPSTDELGCYVCTWSAFHDEQTVRGIFIYGREFVTRVFPVVAVFLLNIAIVAVYRHRQAQGRVLQSMSAQPDVEERRVTYMLLFIGMTYVICMTPMSVLIVVMSVQESDTGRDFEVFHVTANILANMQSACNFYLYFFCSRHMRREFLDLLGETLLKFRFTRRRGAQGFRRSKV